MMARRFSELSDSILDAILARHPYRDAVIGDLHERRAEIESRSGQTTATWWHAREAMRSSLALAPTISVTRGEAVRLLGFVCLVYAGAVRAPGPFAFAAGQALGISSGALFSAFYLVIIAASGGIATAIIATNRRASVTGCLLFLALAVAIGVRHVVTGGHEAGFRALKVAVFLLAAVSGSILGLRGTSSTISQPAK